jgi:hypothetical protein
MSDKDINKMDYKELRNEVQLLRDELAIFKRKYEDLLYNLDTENFSSNIIKEKDGMKTQIELNEKGISTLVSSLGNYSTISQTNNKIAMVVSKSVSATFKSDVKPTNSNTDSEQKGMICEYNSEYYYYNNVSNAWNKCPYQNEIKSLFEQTADGFNLVGDVSVKGRIISSDFETDEEEANFAQMSSTGLEVFLKGVKKLGMGYYEGLHNYPYITFGAGTDEIGTNTGCIYKLGEGLWIGDSSIISAGGQFPGGQSSVADISASYKQATGIFIDFLNEKIYKYIKGVPSEIGSGGAKFG